MRELEATWAAEYQKRCLFWRCPVFIGSLRAPKGAHGMHAWPTQPAPPCHATGGARALNERLPAPLMPCWDAACRHSHKLLRAMTCYTEPFMFVDVAAPGWRIMHVNEALTEQTGACLTGSQDLHACRRTCAGVLHG